MQIKRLSYLVPGFVKVARYAVRWSRMVTQQAKQRAEILAFWVKHGLTATTEAFGVSRRTLFRWQKFCTGQVPYVLDAYINLKNKSTCAILLILEI